MRHFFTIDGEAVAGALVGAGGAELLLGDTHHAVALADLDGAGWRVRMDGVATVLQVAGDDRRYYMQHGVDVYEVGVLDPLAFYASVSGRRARLAALAPMPGNVIAIHVSAGDSVKSGDTLVIIESMKLEVALRAECDATVAAVHCAVGQSFEKDAVLVQLAELAPA